MITKEAGSFIARKIAKNIEEGAPPKQAIAIAFSQARAEGFKVPPPPHIARAERMA